MRAPKSKQFDPVPAGNHVARLYQIIHIGTVPTTYMGEARATDQIRLTFELCNEKKEFKDGEGEKPMSISTRFLTLSMGKKANLRKLVEGILGKTLKDEEAFDLEIETLIGKACLLSVVHEEGSNGTTYSNIQSATPLPKGMEAPDMFNPPKFIDVNETDQDELDALPEFLREKIQSSREYGQRFLGLGASEHESVGEEFDANDVPFD